MISLLAQGFVIGFSLAAPVGPLGLLCIQRTLRQGLIFGVFTGLGVALADAIYGMTAAFGVTVVSDFLIAYRTPIGIGGGLFLACLGLKTLLNSGTPIAAQDPSKNGSQLSTFVSAFFLTLTSPMTIFAYVAIFSGVGMALGKDGRIGALMLIVAIFVGSMTWWLILSCVVQATKAKMQPHHLRLINRCSGIILFGFGLYVGLDSI